VASPGVGDLRQAARFAHSLYRALSGARFHPEQFAKPMEVDALAKIGGSCRRAVFSALQESLSHHAYGLRPPVPRGKACQMLIETDETIYDHRV